MTDTISEVLAAPLRDKPGELPQIGKIVTLRRKHTDLQTELAKANEKREDAIARLRRADDKVRKLRADLVRSTKRLDDARKAASQPNTALDDPL